MTADGAAAWDAATGCLRVDGMAGFRAVDMGAAIPAAVAMGCDPAAAPVLVMAVARGLSAAEAKAQRGEDERDG